MRLDDGILYLCRLTQASRQGGMPHDMLTPKKRLCFAERTVGYGRTTQMAQIGIKVDRLVRTWLYKPAFDGVWHVVIGTVQYRADLIATVTGEDGLRYMDLTLTKLEDYYDVEEYEDGEKIDKRHPPRLRRKA